MKSSSDELPKSVLNSNGKIQIRYNVVEVEKKDQKGVLQKSFDFDFVQVEGALTRGKIIDAIIADSYTKDAEIAMINNELSKPGTQEYILYTAIRDMAKKVADDIELG